MSFTIIEKGSILNSCPNYLVIPVTSRGDIPLSKLEILENNFNGYYDSYIKACQDSKIKMGEELHTYYNNGTQLISFPIGDYNVSPRNIELFNNTVDKLKEYLTIESKRFRYILFRPDVAISQLYGYDSKVLPNEKVLEILKEKLGDIRANINYYNKYFYTI